ncbi:hypothetical protein MAR_021204, partial [Mya arenaria]
MQIILITYTTLLISHITSL